MKTFRTLIILVGVLCMIGSLAACGTPGSQTSVPVSPSATTTSVPVIPVPADTEFFRMLDNIPYSFLEEHDIWFSNQGEARKLHGFEEVNTFAEVSSLTDEEQKGLYFSPVRYC
jgi:hypothetical protein